jgi:hypothetical protein
MLHKRLLSALVLVLLGAGLAHADLDGYLRTLRVSASADFGDYRAGLGVHYGASGAVLDQVFLSVHDPGDAALCFWLARTTGHPVGYVVEHYHKHKGKGWGALAQGLGIKPGSAEFKALKAGQLGWYPRSYDRRGHDYDDDRGRHDDGHHHAGDDDHGRHGGDDDRGKDKSHGKSGGKGKK